MATPFDDNPTFRKFTYRFQWVVNGLLVLLGAYFTATEPTITDFPEWYLVASALGPILWAYLGVQADTNTSAPPPGEGGYGILGFIGVILLVVALILFLGALFHAFATSWFAIIITAVIGLVCILLDGGVVGTRRRL